LSGTGKKKCKRCGKEFEPYRRWQKYCPGGQCRKDAWNDKKPRVPLSVLYELRDEVKAMHEHIDKVIEEIASGSVS
jgi:hypothetical protein